ncbi:MAG: hypothetical protein SPI72_00110 [Porphyromonas sp.]|nr:hypothetical protein [Porphyromonas sp.]
MPKKNLHNEDWLSIIRQKAREAAPPPIDLDEGWAQLCSAMTPRKRRRIYLYWWTAAAALLGVGLGLFALLQEERGVEQPSLLALQDKGLHSKARSSSVLTVEQMFPSSPSLTPKTYRKSRLDRQEEPTEPSPSTTPSLRESSGSLNLDSLQSRSSTEESSLNIPSMETDEPEQPEVAADTLKHPSQTSYKPLPAAANIRWEMGTKPQRRIRLASYVTQGGVAVGVPFAKMDRSHYMHTPAPPRPNWDPTPSPDKPNDSNNDTGKEEDEDNEQSKRRRLPSPPNHLNHVQEQLEHSLPLSFGLRVEYPISSSLSLETGLKYTYLQSQTASKQVQQVHCLGIPIGLNCRFTSSSPFSVYFGFGAQADQVLVAYYSSDKLPYHPQQYSVYGKVGASIRFTRQLGFYIEPQCAYYFHNESLLKTIYKEQPFLLSFSGGLSFLLP